MLRLGDCSMLFLTTSCTPCRRSSLLMEVLVNFYNIKQIILKIILLSYRTALVSTCSAAFRSRSTSISATLSAMSSSILLNSIALKPFANSVSAYTFTVWAPPPVGVCAADLEEGGGGGVGKDDIGNDDDDDDEYADDDDDEADAAENENAEDDDKSTGLRYMTKPSTRSTSNTACKRSFGASEIIAFMSVSVIGSDTERSDRTRWTTVEAGGREPFTDTLEEEAPTTVLLCFSPVGCPLSKILELLLSLTKLFR